jgi:hypothetical protein
MFNEAFCLLHQPLLSPSLFFGWSNPPSPLSLLFFFLSFFLLLHYTMLVKVIGSLVFAAPAVAHMGFYDPSMFG